MTPKESRLLIFLCVALPAGLFTYLAWQGHVNLHRAAEERIVAGADLLSDELAAALSGQAWLKAPDQPPAMTARLEPCPASPGQASGGLLLSRPVQVSADRSAAPANCVPAGPLLARWNRVGADLGASALILRADGSVLAPAVLGNPLPDPRSRLSVLRDVPGFPLRVSYAADPSKLTAQWRSTLAGHAVLAAVLAGLLAGLGAWLLRTRERLDSAFGLSQTRREGMSVLSQYPTSMPPTPGEEPVDTGPGRLPRVLVVDDDPITLEFVFSTLGDYCDVRCATNGREGLRLATESPPDLVITDEVMPGLSGSGMVQALRRNPALDDVPIMMMTGRNDMALQARVLRMGAQDFLAKPLDEGVLLARVHSQLRDRHRAAARAALSARTLACVLETSKDAVVIVDEQHRIALINSVGEAMFRCAREKVLGKGISMLLELQSWQRYMEAVAHREPSAGLAADGRSTLTGRRPGGEPFPLSCSVSRWTDLNGQTFFALVLRDEAERLHQDELLLQAHEDLQRVRKDLRHTLLCEVEARQADIARELHDSVGASLAGVSMILGGARSLANASTEPLLMRAHSQIEAAAEQVRKISRGVLAGSMPGVLLHALEQFADDMSFLQRIRCTVRARGAIEEVDPMVSTQLYRIVQEAAHNALRHGKAATVRIRFVQVRNGCRLTITDDGMGCDFDRLPAMHTGIGLRSIQARVDAIGGSLELRRNGQRGVRVAVTWNAKAEAIARAASIADES